MNLIKKIDQFHKQKNTIQDINIEKILNSLDKFSKKIINDKNFLNKKYRGYGLSFIANWCSKHNLEKILEVSFGSLENINKLNPVKNLGSYKVLPKGILVHWVAGNVPTLGFLSLILGIITKNKNIIRLPLFSKNILVDLLNELKKIDKTALKIFKNILVLKYDKSHLNISKKLSIISDARLIWGSDETCKAIKSLKSKLHCEDLIFSNKVSFIIVDQNSLKNKNHNYLKKISRDILIFDQKACASPHTIFLEKASKNQISYFCSNLSKYLSLNYKRYEFSAMTPQKKMEIFNLRLNYAMKQKVHTNFKNFSHTVLSDDNENLGKVYENGTVFVKKLPNINSIIKNFPDNIQTLGVTKLNPNIKKYLNIFQKKGLARVKLVGEMTNFESIWDGLMIPSRITRLSSISEKL